MPSIPSFKALMKHGSRFGFTAIPEVVETFSLLFDSMNLPFQAVGYSLYELQKLKPEYFKSPKCRDPSDTISSSELADLTEYMAFCLASYGGTYYSYTEEFFMDLEKLNEDGSIIDSAAMLTKWMRMPTADRVKTVIESHTAGDPEGIIFMSYPDKQEAFHCCYYMLDFKPKSEVIVCIRGTLSVQDIMTDLVASAVPFQDGYCHKGMLRTAVNMVDRIRDELKEYVGETGYRVTFTGHSLGASVAAILTMMLKDEFNVRCFAFACPSVFTVGNITASKQYVTSIANSTDIVPRLSYQSFQTLAEEIVDVLETVEPPSLASSHSAQASRFIRRRMHKYMQKEYQKKQDEHAMKMMARKKEYWREQHRAASDEGMDEEHAEGLLDDSDSEDDKVPWKSNPIYTKLRGFVKGFSVTKLISDDAGEPDADADSDDTELLLLPLLPAGRVVQLAGLTHEDTKALLADVKEWRKATGSTAPVVTEDTKVHTGTLATAPVGKALSSINPFNDLMRRLGGLNKKLIFASEVPNEEFSRILIHKSCVIQHHPMVYVRMLKKCVAVQADIADFLESAEMKPAVKN
ncbi:Lipase (class 3) [Carpediemonas membranifera]|uniref:sn-1-specific diacylglycerol lipase n=1 Tax=Carpediemonas membranifera TaxID=201153 RepID=A0A8J6C0L2_9EUKA|nr:Lipase (class 3) [Carpediemonas membranifera]|eukprot:KAG9396696.1 Lipase (class 3) [Carpediemonas membranifera]